MTPVFARPQRMVEPETPSSFVPNLLIPPTPLSNQEGDRWRLRRGRWASRQGGQGPGVMTGEACHFLFTFNFFGGIYGANKKHDSVCSNFLGR